MKNLFIFLMFLFSFNISGEDIEVVREPQEKATIIFKTTNNSSVPIYENLSGTNINTMDAYITIIELKLIANAPVTLKMNPGAYSLQIYKESGIRFNIEAVAGQTQTWLIKPKGNLYDWSLGLIGGGLLAGIIGGVGWNFSQYNTSPDQFITGDAYLVIGISGVAMIISSIAISIFDAPKAELQDVY